jgi:hypothetical protein
LFSLLRRPIPLQFPGRSRDDWILRLRQFDFWIRWSALWGVPLQRSQVHGSGELYISRATWWKSKEIFLVRMFEFHEQMRRTEWNNVEHLALGGSLVGLELSGKWSHRSCRSFWPLHFYLSPNNSVSTMTQRSTGIALAGAAGEPGWFKHQYLHSPLHSTRHLTQWYVKWHVGASWSKLKHVKTCWSMLNIETCWNLLKHVETNHFHSLSRGLCSQAAWLCWTLPPTPLLQLLLRRACVAPTWPLRRHCSGSVCTVHLAAWS